MATVVLIGSLESQGRALEFMRNRLVTLGVDAILVDAGLDGVSGPAAEITREDVIRAAGVDPAELRRRNDRTATLAAMARGAAEVTTRLHAEGLLDAVLGIGEPANRSLLSHAFRALPAGVPRLIVSTDDSADNSLVGEGLRLATRMDELRGIDEFSEATLANAAAAAAGMATAAQQFSIPPAPRPLVAIRATDATGDAPRAARARLHDLGYDAVVFETSSVDDDILRPVVRGGHLTAVLDLAASQPSPALEHADVPQVIALDLDQLTRETRCEVADARRTHGATVAECTLAGTVAIGRRLAERLNAAPGGITLFILAADRTDPTALEPPIDGLSPSRALTAALHEHLEPDAAIQRLSPPRDDRSLGETLVEELLDQLRAS